MGIWATEFVSEWRSLRACKRRRNNVGSSYRRAFRQPLFGWRAPNSSQRRDCWFDPRLVFLTDVGIGDGSSSSTTPRHPAITLFFFFAFKWQRVMERDEETSRSPFFRLKRERERPLRSHLELEIFLFIQEEKSIFRVLMVDGTAHEAVFRSVQCLYWLYGLFQRWRRKF